MTRRLLGAAAVAAVTLAVGASRLPAAPQGAPAQAAALASTPAFDRFAVKADVPAERARVLAASVAEDVPLPTGGNFDGIRWEAMGGTLSRTEIATMLQYNAACQWLRARRDGRDIDAAGRVLADARAWPAWRGTENAALLAAAVAGGEAGEQMLAECDASHEREAQYAQSLGLKASS